MQGASVGWRKEDGGGKGGEGEGGTDGWREGGRYLNRV